MQVVSGSTQISAERSSPPTDPAIRSEKSILAYAEARLLVATSDPETWRIIAESSECGSFVVEIVDNADRALCQVISGPPPDLVVADLPSENPLDGQRLLAALRLDPRVAGIPCLLIAPQCSVNPEPEGDAMHCTHWIREAMHAGADDCLIRPVLPSTFANSVRARLRRHKTIIRHALGNEDSFEAFSSRLLEAIARNLPVTDILQIVARRIKSRLHASLTTCSLGIGGALETVEAEGVPARNWGQFDTMLEELPKSNQPVPIPLVLQEFLRRRCFPIPQSQFPESVWKLPIHNPDGGLLGAFFVFLPPGARVDDRAASDLRPALERKCRLAAVVLDRQRLHEELNRQTHFDPLTGLPNRREFERHLLEAIQRANLGNGSFSILMLDIDRFQRINEVRGYEAADRLLVEIAERLRPACRSGDLLARVAGDEFAVLIPDRLDPDALRRLAQRMLEAFSRPFQVLGLKLLLSASIGICQFPDDGQSIRRLFSSCEIALSEARRERGAHIAFFHPGLGRQTIEGEEIEHYMAEALRTNRFELFYQPQFAVRGALTGFEALIRLRTVDDRILSPGLFLPAAEDAGLIVPIGQWVIEAAFQQAQAWQNSAIGPQRLAINVSPKQLAHHAFVDSVRELIRRYQIDPRLLEFELTESSLMADIDSSGARLEQLKALGVNISIDDFGTGYSSLSYLHEFPIDKVKIDQSFVQRIQAPQHSALPIIEAIIALSKSLGASVLAEGVETATQYLALEKQRCDEVQGFLFSRPLGINATNDFVTGLGKRKTSWFARKGNRS